MEKKFLALPLTLACALCFAGCAGNGTGETDGGGHEHNYLYACDQTEHWQECSYCGEKTSRSPHALTDGICGCGYSERCTEGLKFTFYEGVLEYDSPYGNIGEEVSGYFADGIGTATDSDIYIPSFYRGYPVLGVNESAFNYRADLESVTVGNGVTFIGYEAFAYCANLKNITLGDSVNCIFCDAFDETAYYNDENNWSNEALYIGSRLITNRETISGEYSIKQGTTSIGIASLSGLENLTSIAVPDSVKFMTIIEDGAEEVNGFADCPKLKSITVDKNNNYFSSRDGVLYNKDKTALIRVPEAKTNVTIPDSVTSIGACAFADSTAEIKWGANPAVKEIGYLAFASYKGASIIIPDGVTSIGLVAFDSASIKSITIPDSVTSIGGQAFGYCRDLESAVIGSGITFIRQYSFFNCDNLKSVTFKNTEGWKVWRTSDSIENATSIDVTDTAKNAAYLKGYLDYCWKRG